MKQKALVFRGGSAIGDMLIATPVIRLLAEQGYEVHVACRGGQKEVLVNNPHVHTIHPAPPADTMADLEIWLHNTFNKFEPTDVLIDLCYSIEKEFLHKTNEMWGPIPPIEERRAKAAGKNYYDQNLIKANLEPRPVLPELYASEKEQENLDLIALNKQEEGWQMVMWNTMGSAPNKMLVKIGKWIAGVHDALPFSKHFLVGHMAVEIPSLPRSDRIIQTEGFWSLRDALMMPSIADLVVGPESAIINAAGCWPTPKIIIYSHSAPDNLGRYYLNHYPITPNCDCHPCYLIPLNFNHIWHQPSRKRCIELTMPCFVKNPNYYNMKGLRCTWELDDQLIIDTAVKILSEPQEKVIRWPTPAVKIAR